MRWLLLASVLVGCSSGSGAGTPVTVQKATTCYDANGAVTSSCALSVDETTCAQGDADDCAKTSLIEVHAPTSASADQGVCVHVVIENVCDHEIYSDTCIATTALPEGWQCFRSSTLAGGSIDVSECGATGKLFHYSSASTGSIDAIAAECTKP